MAARLDRQEATLEEQAGFFGFAVREIRAGPNKYRWGIIERDIDRLLSGDRPYPESLVNYLAARYLACSFVEKVPPSEKLLHLISRQLGSQTFGMRGDARAEDDALAKAVAIRDEDPNISNGKLAKAVGVSKPTIGKWERAGKLSARP